MGPYVEQRLQKEGTTVNFTKILTSIMSKNTENWDEMIITQDTDSPGAEQDQMIVDQVNEQFMQMVQGMQGVQDPTQIPPQPMGMEGQNDEQVVQQNMQQLQQMIGQMQQG